MPLKTSSPTNEQREELANKAIVRFMDATGCDKEDALGDLLSDLMHWADVNGQDFDAMLQRAKMHYEAETAESKIK